MEDFSVGRAHKVSSSVSSKTRQIWLWHRRLGHPSFGYLRHLLLDLFSNVETSKLNCDTCILAKSHRATYPLSINKSDTPFALIHSDVRGPSPVSIVSGVHWFVTIVDDCTRMTWLCLLKHKDEVFGVFRSFRSLIQTQISAQIQILCSDNGGEYVNH
jgi:hypothetical protein